MAHPLELSYNWRTPASFASLAAAICVASGPRAGDWLGVALVVVVALWALIVGVIYLRTRAYLLVDGSRLTVRRFRKFHTIEAADLLPSPSSLPRTGPATGSRYGRRTGKPHASSPRSRCCAAGIRPSSRGYWLEHLRQRLTRAP